MKLHPAWQPGSEIENVKESWENIKMVTIPNSVQWLDKFHHERKDRVGSFQLIRKCLLFIKREL
jgi:hypothetical protein